MFTPQSKVKDVWQNPIGHDVLARVLLQMNRSEKWITNPLVANLKLSALAKSAAPLVGPTFLTSFLRVLNNAEDTPAPGNGPVTHAWWKEAVAYQIYPRSFADSNNDGIGDIPGITARVPYLKNLGVDLLWLSPVYDSPNDDNGYDIRDYQKINPEFGTMEDFDSLLHTVHKNDMRLIMDLVVNHTSDEHPWFKAALADPQSSYKDYYIWQKGTQQGAPNNWTSFFSGPAWKYFPETDEYALHLFTQKQMDLNWDNKAMRHDVYAMINWWLEKGVDGFRLDVINYISKDGFADGDNGIAKLMGFAGIEHYFYGPQLHTYLQEMHRESFGKFDAVTVGETPGVGLEMAKLLTGEERKELDLIFNFDILENPGKARFDAYTYDLHYLKQYFTEWQTKYGNNCWPSVFFDNHDNPRMVSKICPDGTYRTEVAKLLGTVQMTLRGTPFIFQGQELGVPNTAFADMQQLRDVESINLYAELCKTMPPQDAFAKILCGTRDHARTPMPWTAGENGGFSTVAPWLRSPDNVADINAETQAKQADSVFSHYRNLIALRHAHPALVYGSFEPVWNKTKRGRDLFCYFRVYKGEKLYVEINFTAAEQPRCTAPAGLTLLASSYQGGAAMLRPYEANVYLVNA